MMTYLMKNKGNPDWHKPDTVVSQKYLSGTAVTNELYVKGHVPKPPKIKKSKPINRSREENQKTRFQLYIGYNVLHIKDFMFVTNQMKSFLLRIFCSLPIPVRI